MSAFSAFLFSWCVTLPLLGEGGSAPAQRIDPAQHSSTLPEQQSDEEVQVADNEFDFWTPCPEESKAAPSLCRGATSGINRPAEARPRNLLGQDISEELSLCAIDAAITKSQLECPGDSAGAAANLAQLMASLAEEWSRSGVPKRAEQLFAKAYNKVAVSDEQLDMPRSAILLAWTKFELERNNLGRAYELAALNTANTRKLYEEWPYQWWLMERALELEASVLERLYRIEEAHAKREELAELARSPNKAKTCWRNREEQVVCRSEPTKVIIICDGGSNGKKGKCWADEAL
jgi:hypothetical protein